MTAALLALAILVLAAVPAPSARPAPKTGASTRAADPYVLIQEAKVLYARGEFRRVLAIVEPLIARYPRSPSSHLLRALALDGLGRLDDAERSYAAALRVAPQDAQILMRYGMHFVRRGAWDQAIVQLQASLELHEDAEALFYLAQAFIHTENKGKALEAIERSAALTPKDPTVLLKLGEYRAQAGKYAPALEALTRAQALNADEPGLDLALGVVHLSLLEVVPAREALERADKRSPDNPAVLANLAEACAKARDHAAAKGYYERVIALGVRDAHTYLGLGIALVGLGDSAAAIVALEQAVEQNPKLAEAHFHLARAQRAAGHPDLAQRELRTFTALKESPFRPFEERTEVERSVWRRVETLLADGKEQDALALLATGNAPGNQPAYLVGALYYSQARLADAERLLQQALRADPKLLKARAYLGLTYLEQGRLAEAEAVIQEELAQNPRDPLALMAAGELQFRKRNWAEAARYLDESHMADPAVLLMLCEARLESGQAAQAQETAQLVATLAAGDVKLLAALRKLLERHRVPMDPEETATTRPTTP